MVDIALIKPAAWVTKKIAVPLGMKAINSFWNNCKKAHAIKSAWKIAAYKAATDYPALTESINTSSFENLFSPVTKTYLEATQRTEFLKMQSGLAKSIVERWNIGKSDAESFTRIFCDYLETELQKNKHLNELALARNMRRTDDNVQQLIDIIAPSASRISQHEIVLREAAIKDLERYRKSLKMPFITVPLGIGGVEQKNNIPDQKDSSSLKPGQHIIIEAGPGCGKTTTLLQFAGTILSAQNFIPIFLPLLDISTGRGVFSAILERGAFSPLGEQRVRLLALRGELTILCDGWNELAPEERKIAWQSLNQFINDYPQCPIILATRVQSSKPSLENVTLVYLSSLTKAQQIELIQNEFGAEGVRLLDRARQIPGLRDLLGIPFYFRTVAQLKSADALPENRNDLIAKFVSNHVTQYERQETLKARLEGEQDSYLRLLAKAMISKNSTALKDQEIREILVDAATELQTNKRIKNNPEPRLVCETLVAHHLLTQQGINSDALYSFQHHQFQEWYASFYVEELILAARTNAKQIIFYQDIVNYTVWEESILFAVERLSRKDTAGVEAVSKFLLTILGIDPMLAAYVISRAAYPVWNLTKDRVIAFVDRWEQEGETGRAFAFMVATEQASFAKKIWAEITGWKLGDVGSLRRSATINPDVLGENAKELIMSLTPNIRTAILWDIIWNGGYKGIEFAAEVAKIETDADVFVRILGALDLWGADTQILELLEIASDEVWKQIARHRELETSFNDSQKVKFIAAKRALIASLPIGHERCLYMFHLDAEGIEDYSDLLVNEILEKDSFQHNGGSQLLLEIAKRHPQKLSQAIVQHLFKDKDVTHYAFEHILPETIIDQSELWRILNKEDASRSCVVLAKLLSEESIKNALNELIVLTGRNDQAARKHYSQLLGILQKGSIEKLVKVVLAVNVTTVKQVATLCEILVGWGEPKTKYPVPHDLLNALSSRAKEWSSFLLSNSKTTRSDAVELAGLLGRIGEPNLLPQLKQIFDLELSLYKYFHATAEQVWKEGNLPPPEALSESRIGYDYQYRAAFEGFDCVELVDVMLSYLAEPKFREQAAFVLLNYVQKRAGLKKQTAFYPDYSQIIVNRAQLAATRDSTAIDPIAAQLIDCAESILSESAEDAVKLLMAAVQMQYGPPPDVFYRGLTSKARVLSRLNLARLLLQNGEIIPIEILLPLIEETEKEVFNDNYSSHDNWYRIEESLELLAFTENTDLISDRFATYPDAYRNASRLRRVIGTLGYSTSKKAAHTLHSLQQLYPELITYHEWCAALARLNSEEAAELLLATIFDKAKTSHLPKAAHEIRATFLQLMRNYPNVRQKMISMIREQEAALQRQIAASMSSFHEGIEEDLFIAIFESAAPTEKETFRLLSQSLEGLAMLKRPIDASNGSYNLEPADTTQLRKRLFQKVLDQSPLARIALDILYQIERIRDEYGRPPAEPRHPNINSNQAFPLSAQPLWDAS